MPKCPKCDRPLAQDGAAGSQCPVCTALLKAVRPAGSDVSPGEQAASSHIRCFFCQRQEPCEMGYFRIGYVNWWVFFVTQRWLKIRCQCCNDCRQTFVTTSSLKNLIRLAIFSLPMIVCLGIYLPFFAANKDPIFQPGQPGAITVGLGLLCMPWIICIPLGCLFMRYIFMSRALPRLHREKAEALRSTLGGWGFLPSIIYSKEKPWLDSEYLDS